ncbi:hypothetical protein GCM10011506_16560 [Marivirga lumbricoides]|uniref:Glycosyltransferase 2-like domain-containing protein n=2 Tax=Marivirga lumbricoides TaxID=1046115 RepID=A0ABQ1LYN6_9BACT|nr:hypothetical protein GCM10011506_16560 [Marivirga lumbricoides]
MAPNTFLSVVIPVYNEENLLKTLQSLDACVAPQFPVEVILVVNFPEEDSEDVIKTSFKTLNEIESFKKTQKSPFLTIRSIEAFSLAKKQAGVGLARKIGMDEATYRFSKANIDGVIVCFDADSECDKNYLITIENYFLTHADCTAASIHFEHPLYENEKLNEPIILYELHLRYYVQALKHAEYPYAFHTIGSSMAVKSSIYQKQGGMNTRKAGEDFYFLHKVIPLGNYRNITSTKVIPSARKSDRVPFGTGRAMKNYEEDESALLYSYNFKIFEELKLFINLVETEEFPQNCNFKILQFLKDNDFEESIERIKTQAKNKKHFKERFFQWFNGFRALKFVHYFRDAYYPNILLVEATSILFSNIKDLTAFSLEHSAHQQLLHLRAYEKENP